MKLGRYVLVITLTLLCIVSIASLVHPVQANLSPTSRVGLYVVSVDGNKIEALNGITGVVDYSGSDAATVINAALSAMTSGGEIYLKAGTYALSSPIYLPNRRNILIAGEGNSTILSAAGKYEAVIYLLGTSNSTIQNLAINGNESSYDAKGISMAASDHVTVNNVVVQNCLEGGIMSYQGGYHKILNSRIVGNGATRSQAGFGSGIDFDSSSFSLISGNVVASNYNIGIWATGTSATTYGYLITNNTVYDNGAAPPTTAGIQLGTSTLTVYNSTISNNIVEYNHQDGIWLYQANGNLVTGNTVYHNGDTGISMHTATGNQIQANNVEQNEDAICILVNSNNNLITGNQLNANRNYGIDLDATNTGNVIENNYFSDNGASPAIAGTLTGSTIINNIGYTNTSYGLAFAVMGIGVGVAAAGVGVAVAMSRRGGSEVLSYGGYYYCRRHRVPVWFVNGGLWCPIEQRHLRTGHVRGSH
jgi:parallel beta-helix repeat protein